MKKIIIIIFILFTFFFLEGSYAENIRKAVWAGKFYPSDSKELETIINRLTKQAKKIQDLNVPDAKLKAVIMPHAGYIYSGLTAAHTSFVLENKQFKNVILMGPDHRVGINFASISNASFYETPLGKVQISDISKKLLTYSIFKYETKCDNYEHSLEVILPFLQIYLKNFKLLPIVIGHIDPISIYEKIDSCLDNDTLIVVSTDLSHYLSYKNAIKKDKETIDMILNFDFENLKQSENAACGIIPIITLLQIAKKNKWQPILLHYSNSGDTSGTKDRVVGYAAIAFYGGLNMIKNNQDQITKDQGDALIKLARQTIAQKLDIKKDYIQSSNLKDKIFNTKKGTFVTLNKHGRLRGCIGSLIAHEPIIDGIKHNAVNAAFNDPRFPSLKKEEFNDIEIEVSVLTEPKPLSYKDADDLINKIRPNIDGLIIKKGYYSATFLPQVWEQLPSHEEFLSHLCNKAGLSSNAWKKGDLEVLTYQVQYFEE